jgi:FkbM family methyltransferase
MNEYDSKLITKNESVDSLTPWTWIDVDASWGMIKADWLDHRYREKILKYCSKTNLVVQAGGNQGMYPRLLAEFFNKVYTFEPHPLSFHVLNRNCQKNNIIKINGALSNACGQFTLVESNLTNAGCHIMEDAPHRNRVGTSGTEYTIQAFTVDSLNLPELDLLMLDIETYEYYALLGSVHTIQKYHPVIICEGPPSLERFYEKTEYLLNGLGYKKVDNLSWDSVYIYDN